MQQTYIKINIINNKVNITQQKKLFYSIIY